jgi:hypothetical protein
MQASVLRQTLQASPGAVREARRLAVEFIQRECPQSAEIESAVALVSEAAVGNVVRHAQQDRASRRSSLSQLEGEDTVVVSVGATFGPVGRRIPAAGRPLPPAGLKGVGRHG